MIDEKRRGWRWSGLPVFALLGYAAVASHGLFGQSFPYNLDTRPQRGFMPNSSQLATGLDTIDTVSGNVKLQVPLASLPPGRAGHSFDLDLVYNSQIYDIEVGNTRLSPASNLVYTQELQTGANGGWHYNYANYKVELELRQTPPNGSGCTTTVDQRPFRMRIGLGDGSLHTLHLRNYGDELGDGYYGDGFYGIGPDGKRSTCAALSSLYPSNLTGRLYYYTSDGSFLKLEIDADGGPWWNHQWRLYLPDGRRITGFSDQVDKIYDANGNFVEVDRLCRDTECQQPYVGIFDEVGRSIAIDFNNVNPNNTTQDSVTGPGFGGVPVIWTVNWGSILVGGAVSIGGDGRQYECGPESTQCPLSVGHRVVTSVNVPSTPQTSYQFGYSTNSVSGYGEIKSVTMPYGSQTTYQYLQEGLVKTLATLLDNPAKSKLVTHDGVTDPAWTYTFTNSSSTIANPDGGSILTSFYDPKVLSDWKRGLVWKVERPGFSVTERVWAQNKAYGRQGSSLGDPNNPFVQQERASVANTAGSQVKTAIANFSYDKNGNVLSSTEYAWVAYGVTTGSTPLRSTTASYYVPALDSSNVTDSSFAYWWPHNGTYWADSTSARRLNAVKRKTVSDGSTNCASDADGGATCAITEFAYDSPYEKGNVTALAQWDSVKLAQAPGAGTALNSSNALVQTRSYDSYGNLTDIFEPEVQTHLTYGSIGLFTNLYPTQIMRGTGTVRTQNLFWDSASGLLQLNTDVENSTTTSYLYDGLGRRTRVTEAGLRQVNTIYDDALRNVMVKRDLRGNGNGELQTVTHYDQLGRVRKARTSDGAPLTASDESGGIKVDMRYFMVNGGEYRKTSNPYRATGDATMGWTCTQMDKMGRVVRASTYAGATEPANCSVTGTGFTTTTYDADKATVTDAAGSTREQYVDAAGRLVSVIEYQPAAYTTTYTYSPMNNLRKVLQGAQTRTFVYSSLGRLRSANNPEKGTTSYTYFDNGEIATKTDGAAVTLFTYDGLHRISGKSYTGVDTPAVTYSYYLTGQAPKVGRLQAVSTSAGSMSYNYDTLGRVTSSFQTIAGIAAPFQFSNYSYLLNDALTSVTYPSNRVVNQTYDDAGRILTLKDPSKTNPYVDMTVVADPTQRYTATGQVSQTKLGNGLWEKRDFNTLGQTTALRLGTAQGANDRVELGYTYASSSNNGNVQSHTVTLAGWTRTQNYGYDLLNRLTSAQEGGGNWTENYGYDQYGNRWVTTSSGFTYAAQNEPGSQSAIDATNNRLTGLGYTDGRGNLTQHNPHTLSYDAENRLKTTSSTSNGSLEFSYDGDGRRVKKMWTPGQGAAVTTYYVYDAFGNLAAEYGGSGSSSGTQYLFADHLGSTRVKTDGTGAVVTRHDYLPFGRQLSTGDDGRTTGMGYMDQADPMQEPFPIKFTSKERDAETGLDYFGARYMSSAQGRFTSPDKPFMDQHIADPQSWNLYSYGRNNPLMYVDPSGEAIELIGDEDERKRALAVLASTVGKAGSNLTINSAKDGDSTRYFVGVKEGSLQDFAKTGDAAKGLADMIGAKPVVEFGVTDKALPGAGAGQAANTYAPGEIGNQNVRILVNPKLAAEFNPTGLMRLKWDTNATLRSMTPGIAAWHEMGHAWAMWQDMNARSNGVISPDPSRALGQGPAVQRSVDWENRIRQDLYGPLGPNNARRIYH